MGPHQALGSLVLLHVNSYFCLFRVLSYSPHLLVLSPRPLEGQDSPMTPLKVNRTLPLCLRRNLLLHGLNRPAVSTLSSLTAAHPPTVTGRCGAEGPFVHQPRLELCCGVCTGNKRAPPLPLPLSTHAVCLEHSSRPVLWARVHSKPRWSPKGPGLRAFLGARRDATQPLADMWPGLCSPSGFSTPPSFSQVGSWWPRGGDSS